MEVGSRKLVTVRKDHTCLGCQGTIQSGDQAVTHSGKTDGKGFRFHLHIECNHFIMKHRVYLEDQVWTNCIHDLKKDFAQVEKILF